MCAEAEIVRAVLLNNYAGTIRKNQAKKLKKNTVLFEIFQNFQIFSNFHQFFSVNHVYIMFTQEKNENFFHESSVNYFC